MIYKNKMIENLPGAAYDNKIYAKFSKNTIEKKMQNKNDFCEEFEITPYVALEGIPFFIVKCDGTA